MRRLAAILLLALTALLPLDPLLAGAQSSTSLPACCRCHGMHHCMMTFGDRLLRSLTSQPILTSPPCSRWKLTRIYKIVTAPSSSRMLSSHPISVGQVVEAAQLSSYSSRFGLRSSRAPPALPVASVTTL